MIPIQLDEVRQRRRPQPAYIQGAAKCLRCQHTWRAVAPDGTSELECPWCGCDTGVWAGLFNPGMRWVCDCGNDFFYLTPGGVQCVSCGHHSEGLPA